MKAKTAQVTTTSAFLDTEMNHTTFLSRNLRTLCPFSAVARGGLPKSLICYKTKLSTLLLVLVVLLVTLRDRRKTQQTAPKIASPFLVSPICLITFFMTSMKVSAENFNPNKFLNWAEAIVIAPADVKPATTGVDTKSTRKPLKKKLLCGLKWFYW